MDANCTALSLDTPRRRGAFSRWLVLCLTASLSFTTPARSQEKGPKPRSQLGSLRAPLPDFAHALKRGSFEFSSDFDEPLESLAALGERALLRLRPWIGLGAKPRRSEGPCRVFLCRDVDKIRAIERAIGQPQLDPDRGEKVAFRGGYYSGARLIAIPAKAGEDMRWDFVHELGHAVYSEFLLGYLISVDEGIAEYSAERMIEAEPDAEALLRERRDWLLDQCRLAVSAGLPALEDFVPLGHWQFLDAKVRSRNYALAWSLVRYLERSQEQGVSGRFGKYLRRMARSRRPWQSFQETWDLPTLGPLWREYVEGISHWASVYGDWTYRQGEISTMVADEGSSWTLWRKKPDPEQAVSLSFRLGAEGDPDIDVGFVLGHVDWENFVLVEVRADGRLWISRRRAGAWQQLLETEVVIDRDMLMGRRLKLDCDREGRIELSLAGNVLVSHDLGGLAHAGWVGLFAGRPKGRSPRESARVVFRDAMVHLGR